MIHEQLEFLIGQYLDGTLPAGMVGQLEKLLQTDAFAQRVLEEQLKLDKLIRSAALASLPQVEWDKLAAQISEAIAAEAVQAPAEGDIEVAIIGYVDGTLDDAARQTLEAQLASDPAAQQLLRQHQALSSAMNEAWKLPAVNWDALSREISAGVDSAAALTDAQEQELTEYLDGRLNTAAAAQVEALLEQNAGARLAAQQHDRLSTLLHNQADLPLVNWDALAGQISSAVAEQAQARRMNIGAYLRIAGAFAAAACLAVALWFAVRPGGNTKPIATNPPVSIVEVAVAMPEPPKGAAIEEISIGPSAAYAEARFDRYSPGVVAVETRVQIASVQPVRYSDGWSME